MPVTGATRLQESVRITEVVARYGDASAVPFKIASPTPANGPDRIGTWQAISRASMRFPVNRGPVW